MSAVSRRDPLLAELDSMAEQLQRAFGLRVAGGPARGFVPPVDIWETENEIVIEIDVPGVDPQNLSAEIVDNQLVVTGERSPSSDGAVRRYRTERWQGRFVRSFAVPQGIDGDRINAEYRDGVLRLTLPKPEERKPRRISIGHTGESQPIETTASQSGDRTPAGTAG
jgi:HSP20 family protein